MERVWEKQQGAGQMWATQPTAQVSGSWLASSADVQGCLPVGQEVWVWQEQEGWGA